MKRKKLNQIRKQRVRRVRARVRGAAAAPRLSVSRSNRGMYVQLIDDGAGRTLASASTKGLSQADLKKPKTEQAFLVGERLAKKALDLGIKQAVFDRRHYRYHGRVRAVADGARRAGLQF